MKEQARGPRGLLLVVAMGLTLVGCGSRLDGTTYETRNGLVEVSVKFEGGKATLSTMGVATEVKYELDGEKLKLVTPQGTMVLTVNGDTIEGWQGAKLYKK